ncbi:MAG TPA: PEP-CTERM sorting domain-containing protein [Roseiarcus sp.]|nr:PEP-CTERM sorting domain-containing protein [Roseiarcus sp.]
MIVKMLAAAAALAAMTAAARADITQNFFIEASDFTLSAGPGGEPPAEPMTGVCELVAGGWCAFIGDGSQAFPFLDELSFWADNGGEWVPQHATLNIGLAGAVPEPSTWTLTLIGFGGMAWPLRRGRWGARRGGACLRPGGSARERRRTISPA